MNTQIKEQVKKLIEDDKLKQEALKMFPNYKPFTIIHEWKGEKEKCIYITLENKDNVKDILNIAPPINKTNIVEVNGKQTELSTPFRINLENPAQPAFSYIHRIEIIYKAKKHTVKITLPIKEIEQFVVRTSRRITDCEYHYFVGMSYEKLIRHTVMAYEFKYNVNVVNWYGGNKTLLDANVVNEIINHLNN